MSKFMRFWGGPNWPKTCVRGTKFSFKDWDDRHHDHGQHNQRRSPRLLSKRTHRILPVMETSLLGTFAQLEARLLRWQEINQPKWTANIKENGKYKNKAQRTRGLLSGYQSNILRSYHKFLKKSYISSNFNQISEFRLHLNIQILIKRSFRYSTKNNLYNLNQRSAAKYWLNFSFKISPELQLQNLDQTLCSKTKN